MKTVSKTPHLSPSKGKPSKYFSLDIFRLIRIHTPGIRSQLTGIVRKHCKSKLITGFIWFGGKNYLLLLKYDYTIWILEKIFYVINQDKITILNNYILRFSFQWISQRIKRNLLYVVTKTCSHLIFQCGKMNYIVWKQFLLWK